MKKLMLILLLISLNAQAGDFTASFMQLGGITDDDTYFRGDWHGIKLDYQFDNSNNFVFISHERADIIPFWGIGSMYLSGIGFGSRFKVTDNIKFFGQVGYYLVEQENEGKHEMKGGAAEGMHLYFNQRYHSTTPTKVVEFDDYEIRYDNTIAGEAGIELQSGSVVYALSYRSMKVREFLRVYKDEWHFEKTGACWEQQNNRNFDSVNFSIGWRF